MDDTAVSEPAGTLTHADFAVLLLQTFQTKPTAIESADDALAEVKRLKLVPQTWSGDDMLTHGELAQVVLRFGGTYQASDPDPLASRSFTEALLRRQVSSLKTFMGNTVTHGDASAYAMDFGADRGVSPSDF